MRGLLYLVVGLVGLVLENFAVIHLPIRGCGVQFTLLFVAFLGLGDTPIRNLALAFGFGYLTDALVSTVPGFGAIAYLTVCAAVIALGRMLYMRSLSSLLLVTVIASVLWPVVRWLLLTFFGRGAHMAAPIFSTLPLQIAINLVSAILVFPIFFRIDRATDSGSRDGGYLHDYR
ncbi:MAG: rod shape-determining protein MreD [Deltaproteobacteria bacterium]|nr:rod shape-determining protein MreD [Deltaproteobacteria bacterium]